MAKVHSCLSLLGLLVVIYLAGAGPSLAQAPLTNTNSANSAPSGLTADDVAGMLHDANQHLQNGELDEALRLVDSALQIDPRQASAYDLRGAIYVRNKLWDRAEQDYTTASTLDPTVSEYKYNLGEIEFMQKAYDDARPRFTLLLNDKDFGDLAAYKVFLCDLLTSHEERATTELAAINKTEENPSYYYANATWDLTHNKIKDADDLIDSARQVFDSSKNAPYLSSLMEVNDLHATVVSFVTKEGDQYDRVRTILEDEGLRVASSKGWITIPFDQLPDDLSSFPDELRKRIEAKRRPLVEASSRRELLSFTTKQGKRYDQVSVSLGDGGLLVLTPDGLITVPLDELPDDLSPFPDELRQQIRAERQSPTYPANDTGWLTFTTKQGKKYEEDRVSVQNNGLEVITSDGWITVPFDQLPDDLSSFPAELRKQIIAKRQSIPDAVNETETLSFITKKGIKYDEARFYIGNDGLQVLTSDGWNIVPFDQLPDDLSTFPAELRSRIAVMKEALLIKHKATLSTTPPGKPDHQSNADDANGNAIKSE
jgi:Tfp pilus assembly protein PilF